MSVMSAMALFRANKIESMPHNAPTADVVNVTKTIYG